MFSNAVGVECVTASLGELGIEASSSKDTQTDQHESCSGDVAVLEDDIWDDASDGPSHASSLDREWTYRQNQFHKMGYRDGITKGQKDSAQEGFNVGFRQSVQAGYKWGLVRGITSALASLSDGSRDKLVPDMQCIGKLQGLHNSVQEISADDALQMFRGALSRITIQERYHKHRKETEQLILIGSKASQRISCCCCMSARI